MAQNRTTGLWARIKGLFAERPFEPGDWRPASKIELLSMGSSPTSRQFVRVGEDDFSPLTRRLSRTKYIEMSQGAPPVKLARERKTLEGQHRVPYKPGERGRKSWEATRRPAGRKRAYPGQLQSDIERFKDLQRRKRNGEWLDDDDFHWMLEFMQRNEQIRKTEYKFLNETFLYPKNRRKLTPELRSSMKAARTRKAARKRDEARVGARRGRGR